MFWLVKAFELIDYNYETFITEAFSVGQNTNIFTYTDLKDMDFKSYQFIIKTIGNLNKENKNGS